MGTALDALRRVDLQWTRHVDSVWRTLDHDVSAIQSAARAELDDRLEALRTSSDPDSPLGVVLMGPARSGKTHLLSWLRREAHAAGMLFVLVDMTDVQDFAETVLLGLIQSLGQPHVDGRPQYTHLLAALIERYGDAHLRELGVDGLAAARPPALGDHCDRLIACVRRAHRQEGARHQEVLRALALMASDDPETADTGLVLLQGIDESELRDPARSPLHMRKRAMSAIRGISWVASIAAPAVVALDQLDAIVAEHHVAAGAGESQPETVRQQISRAIIHDLAGGLSALRDSMKRTQIVVACLEQTWHTLETRAVASVPDRFESPLLLRDATDGTTAQCMIEKRLASACRAVDFSPPYPSYPFADAFFSAHSGESPRGVLKRCDRARRTMLRRGEVDEIGAEAQASETALAGTEDLVRRLEALRDLAPISRLLASENEEELDRLLETACLALEHEIVLPADVDAQVDCDFGGRRGTEPLHARFRTIDHRAGDRERHYALRFIQRANAVAFQCRLKAAMTASGIDADISYRRLALLRVGPRPSGPVTTDLLAELDRRGGTWIEPSETELRTLWALAEMWSDPELAGRLCAWVAASRPVSQLPALADAVSWISAPRGADGDTSEHRDEARGRELAPEMREAVPTPDSPESTAATHATDATQATQATQATEATRATEAPRADEPEPAEPSSAKSPAPRTSPDRIQIGRRVVGRGLGDDVALPLHELRRHAVVLAGAGSGKTVLLKRMIEEAAIAGVPSIVIDGANDMALLGELGPEAASDDARDAEMRALYRDRAEVVVWTPGAAGANPLVLDPIPDFAALGTDKDELDGAIDMLASALSARAGIGSGQRATIQLAVLTDAIRYLAKNGGSLLELIDILRELPPEASSGISKDSEIAAKMGDQLLAATRTDPLLRGDGARMDPRVLLGSSEAGRARISVLSLCGLPDGDARRGFVEQLCMALFSHIRRHPAAPDQPLLGLLVVDEAADFVPAGRNVIGKASLIRLAAQARKYGLGLLFATQAPKSIDHNIIANCTTQLYGKASSPAAIATITEQVQQRGGRGADVATLPRGTFYLASETITPPVKIAVPMCLSHHTSSPPTEACVLERARRSRSDCA